MNKNCKFNKGFDSIEAQELFDKLLQTVNPTTDELIQYRHEFQDFFYGKNIFIRDENGTMISFDEAFQKLLQRKIKILFDIEQ